jgi:hypothetical protein
MKHNISILILTIGILLSTTAIAGINTSMSDVSKGTAGMAASIEKTVSFNFSPLQYGRDGDYTTVRAESLYYTSAAGLPHIPYAVRTLILPAGTVIERVIVHPGTVQEKTLEYPIAPVPQPVPLNMQPPVLIRDKGPTYNIDEHYPKSWITWRAGVGLREDQRTLYLAIHAYPMQYNPMTNHIRCVDNIEVSVHYRPPITSMFIADSHDFLIISPADFLEVLQPLVDHKESHEISTMLVTLADVYAGTYFPVEGRDEPEQIKYFIKNAVEEWGVTYVLLVGGMRGQQFEWYLPVRYTNNHAGSPLEEGFISDLYYADLYKYEDENIVFADWDSNGNGVFAEYSNMHKDIMDLHPDVFLGRLPCRSVADVEIMVNKIITYENGKPRDQDWFNKMLLIGGDTYPNAGDPDAYEAEIDTALSGSYMEGLVELEQLWASTGTLTGQEDVEAAISAGCGFIHMAGHANPGTLVTHPPKDDDGRIVILDIYNIPPVNAIWALYGGGIPAALDKLNDPWMPSLTNGDKLPVVVVGGCHNSQFNTSLLNIFKYGFVHAYGYGIHVPKCWSWWLTSLADGGSIATLGNTGLGMGIPAWNYTEGLDGWLFPRFFYHYGVDRMDILAPLQAASIDDYINTFDINRGDADRQMVTQWALFGDPTLKIGGY